MGCRKGCHKLALRVSSLTRVGCSRRYSSMELRALHLTEQTLAAHEADWERLESILAAHCQHLGVYEPFEDGTDWTPEAAEERLLRKGPLHPILYAMSRAMNCALRSICAVSSARERTLSQLIELRDILSGQLRAMRDYERERREEVATELYLDRVIGWKTPHGEEREQLVAEKIASWHKAMEAALRETTDLAWMLLGERPVAVQAGLYDAKGAGLRTEVAFRLLEAGIHPRLAALLRNDVKVSDPTFRSSAQQAEVRHKGEALRREVERAVERIRAVLRVKTTDAIA